VRFFLYLQLINFYNMLQKRKNSFKRIVKEYKDATTREIIEAIVDNALYGFLGAVIVVAIATKMDVAVLGAYFIYYSYVGKIINRPKYVTDLGKIVIFPTSSALGAFTGYKLSYYILEWLK
jgi:hypothetical protein